MANVRKGIIRILWILSIGASIAAWIFLFRTADLKPEKKINNAGVAFVNILDKHYFADAPGLTLSEYRLTKSERNRKKVERILTIIENSIKSDSVDRWPFVSEYIPANTKRLDPDLWDVHTGWQDRMRKELQMNEKEIKSAFPDINFDNFMQRYSNNPIAERFGSTVLPESYFNISYQRPWGRIGALFLLGLLPFAAIWLLLFMANWVINGFKG